MRVSKGRLIAAAIRHPHCTWRHVTGRSPSDIDLAEITGKMPAESVVVEAGAADGTHTEGFAQVFPRGRVFALEPVPKLYRQAANRISGLNNVELTNAALGPIGQDSLTLHVDDAAGHSSSALRPTEHKEIFPEIQFTETCSVTSTTLDDFLEARGINRVDLLWLDLQGFELTVLSSGGAKALQKTSLVHLEVCRKPLYEGAPVMSEVVTFMGEAGFKPVITRVPIYFGNILFARRNEQSSQL